MDMTNDIAQFLTSRRARIAAERACLPTYGKRRRRAAHNVRLHRTGTRRLHQPVVGALELS